MWPIFKKLLPFQRKASVKFGYNQTKYLEVSDQKILKILAHPKFDPCAIIEDALFLYIKEHAGNHTGFRRLLKDKAISEVLRLEQLDEEVLYNVHKCLTGSTGPTGAIVGDPGPKGPMVDRTKHLRNLWAKEHKKRILQVHLCRLPDQWWRKTP